LCLVSDAHRTGEAAAAEWHAALARDAYGLGDSFGHESSFDLDDSLSLPNPTYTFEPARTPKTSQPEKRPAAVAENSPGSKRFKSAGRPTSEISLNVLAGSVEVKDCLLSDPNQALSLLRSDNYKRPSSSSVPGKYVSEHQNNVAASRDQENLDPSE